MNSTSLDIDNLCFKKTNETKLPKSDLQEWNYAMRREMQEIIPGVYLGPFSAATRSKVDTLIAAGITHIVCVRHEQEAAFIHPIFPEKFKYTVINLSDTNTSSIIPLLSQVKLFIDNSLKSGGKVLVHGNSGISRSATLVIAYVMETKVLPFKDAFLLVQKKRHCICPNDSFIQQLKEYEPIYRAKRGHHVNGHTSKVTGKLKRRFDEVDETSFGNSMDVCM